MKQIQTLDEMKNNIHELDFIAIDFETATASMGSACSLGVAAVQDCTVVSSAHMLIRPPLNAYNPFNIRIHGITPRDTYCAPTFWQLWPQIAFLFSACPLIAHNARFDMSVLRGCLGEHAKSRVVNFQYYDTLQMVKGLVPGSRSLPACSEHFGVCLDNHHNAEADAIACAEIAIACLRHHNLSTLEDFSQVSPGTKCYAFYKLAESYVPTFSRQAEKNLSALESETSSKRPFPFQSVSPKEITPSTTDFDPRHPLYQKTIVFTGEMSLSRRDAMQMAADVGAVLRSNLSKSTDYLVVGRPNAAFVGGDARSSKERKALEYRQSGESKVELLTETGFLALISNQESLI